VLKKLLSNTFDMNFDEIHMGPIRSVGPVTGLKGAI